MKSIPLACVSIECTTFFFCFRGMRVYFVLRIVWPKCYFVIVFGVKSLLLLGNAQIHMWIIDTCVVYINIVNDIIFKNHTVYFAKPKLIKYTPRTHTYINIQTHIHAAIRLFSALEYIHASKTYSDTYFVRWYCCCPVAILICGNSWYFFFSVLVLLIANCALFYGSGKSRFWFVCLCNSICIREKKWSSLG